MLPSASILLQRYSQWWQMDLNGYWLNMVLLMHILHYLDDFIFVTASMGQAMRHKHTLVSNFYCLGVPLEQSKLHSRSFNWPDIPGYCNQHWGSITTYTSPQVKLTQLKQELSHCILRNTITERELQNLTGLLQFATKVIRPGRPFIRQLYTIQSIGLHPDHHICLNSTARADIIIMVVPICREMEWYFLTLG